MRKVTTILCSIAFMISGIMLATANDSSSKDGYKTLAAAVPMSQQLYANTINPLNLSEDLVRDLAKQKGVQDTVYITKTDTIKEQVTKVKWRKAPAPAPVAPDTILVPVYYLATQVGNKEGPTGECISVYEVHKVDEICPETSISCGDNDVGE